MFSLMALPSFHFRLQTFVFLCYLKQVVDLWFLLIYLRKLLILYDLLILHEDNSLFHADAITTTSIYLD